MMKSHSLHSSANEKSVDNHFDLSKSVLHCVNPYHRKEFPLTDEEKMMSKCCEQDRKLQRKQRVEKQLKMRNESMDDEFEKFFEEGFERWSLVKDCCLDERIWDWKVKTKYTDVYPEYGCGKSEIRKSPFEK